MRPYRLHREDPAIMDAPRFDAIARRLSRSRRGVLGSAVVIALSWNTSSAAPRPGLGERCKPKSGCAAGSCINRTCACGAGQRRCGSTCIANGQCCNADGERRCGNTCISGSTCCTDDGERRCGNGCTKPGECCHADGERQCSDGRCIAGDRYCSARECPPIGNGDPCIEVVLNQQGGCATRNAAAGTPCGMTTSCRAMGLAPAWRRRAPTPVSVRGVMGNANADAAATAAVNGCLMPMAHHSPSKRPETACWASAMALAGRPSSVTQVMCPDEAPPAPIRAVKGRNCSARSAEVAGIPSGHARATGVV